MARLLSTSEVAEYLQVSESTLIDWRYKSIGPPYAKMQRLVRYPEDQLNEWVASNTAAA